MITAPTEITLKAPDDNAHYWKSFVSMLKQRKEYHLKHGLTISRRRTQLKRLLSRELDLCQIALEMSLPLKLVDEYIWYLGWEEFLQPGKRKEADRAAWQARKKVMATDEQYKVLESAIKYALRRLRDANYLPADSDPAMFKDWVEDEARAHFIRCLRNYNSAHEAGASFKTYFNNIWRLKIKRVMEKIGKEYDFNRTIHRARKIAMETAA
ncbi:hypothetical protein [Pseudodesulfovibrio senegalensis]|uniref:Uncharacterized protein n=1 Tax=Pseudodesulfovibrio senegalensis TaxID=1721087 RepID=A0A6N6N5P7_9BACT|nr:hypothetical protein [Pseudodesulfovibrio senegalensis]KAB1443071.1 hypothetical protein F8A88_02060 [Pseudodesulfovibrio senegalensis]